MTSYELEDIILELNMPINELADRLGVNVFVFEKWVKETWLIPIVASNFLRTLLKHKQLESDGYYGYHCGFDAGYQDGYMDGYKHGGKHNG